ncbi:MAG: protein phosphatase 2C domain-containing protein, partial [Fusobacterium periodonticum]|nr:protein phosphatase 2C domain-containing protein [Fusobacterium periodonticum]
MKYGAYSEKGSYHKRNQDSFIIKKVRGIYVAGISDGLGSKKYSHVGSKLLCKSLLDIVYKVDDFEKISKEKLIELIFQNWLKKIKNLKKYPIEECSATFLFAIILKEKIIVSRVGDGFI